MTGCPNGQLKVSINMGMSAPTRIPVKYFSSLVSQRTGKPSYATIMFQCVFPVFVAFLLFVFHAKISSVNSIINGVAIVAALLCAVATMLFQIRIDLRIKVKSNSDAFISNNDLELVDELFAALLWGIMFGFIITAIAMVIQWADVLNSDNTLLGYLSSSILIACVVHFASVIGLILKRLSAVYQIVAIQKR